MIRTDDDDDTEVVSIFLFNLLGLSNASPEMYTSIEVHRSILMQPSSQSVQEP